MELVNITRIVNEFCKFRNVLNSIGALDTLIGKSIDLLRTTAATITATKNTSSGLKSSVVTLKTCMVNDTA